MIIILYLEEKTMGNSKRFIVGGLRYEVNTDGKSVSVIRNKKFSTIIIPSRVTYKGNDYTVTKIGYRAFNNDFKLNSIIIPDSISEIGYMAFAYCIGQKYINSHPYSYILI